MAAGFASFDLDIISAQSSRCVTTPRGRKGSHLYISGPAYPAGWPCENALPPTSTGSLKI